MSAFIVGTDHIDYLVAAAIQFNIPYGRIVWEGQRVEIGNADAVGAGLLRENIASVMHRYSHRDDVHAPDPDAYRYRPFGAIDPVQTIKAVGCLEYQSCEHPEWKDSDAARFCDHLRDVAISRVPGYDDAQWEVSR